MKTSYETAKPPNRPLPLYYATILVNGTPATWLRTIKQVTEDHDFLVRSYHPLRRGLNNEIQVRGSAETIMKFMFSNRQPTDSNKAVEEKSFTALRTFRQKFLPSIESIEDDLVANRSRTVEFRLGASICVGQFHAIVRLKDGSRKLVYYHASNWTPKQVKAAAELLGMMAEAMGYRREDVWFLDLVSGKAIPASGGPQLRRQLFSTGGSL